MRADHIIFSRPPLCNYGGLCLIILKQNEISIHDSEYNPDVCLSSI